MLKTYDTLEGSDHSQPRVAALIACKNNLMAASWHMPISKLPFRYAVAVREENYTHRLLEEHGSFTLNFLPFEYCDVMDMMGRLHGNEHDKLELSGLQSEGFDTEGNVLLNASDFIYACRVCDTYKNGDHTIFIADVVKIHVNETQSDQPMLFSGHGNYASTTKVATAKHPL